MTDDYDYGEHAPKATPSVIAQLTEKLELAASLEGEIASMTENLQEKEALLKQLTEKDIPGVMEKEGLTQFKTRSGLKVSLFKQLFASVPSVSKINGEHDRKKKAQLIKQRDDGIRWLEENGHGDIVKRELTVQLGKGEAELAAAVKEAIYNCPDAEGIHVEEGVQVHHKTLSKLLAELRSDSKPIPEELFGVYEPSIAKVSR